MILFLGSGVSLASGLPAVADIQTALLNLPDQSQIGKLLSLLLDIDTAYLTYSAPFKHGKGEYGYTGQLFRSATTYEDLFYLLDQIVTNAEGLKADLAIEALADLVRRRGRTFLKGRKKIDQSVSLHRLATETRDYIEETVSVLLRSDYVTGLDLIVQLINEPQISSVHIVTLNHDTLVEQILSTNNIEYSDGFGAHDGDVRWFENQFASDANVTLIKPHGSISWWLQAGNHIVQPVNTKEVSSGQWKNRADNLIRDINKTPSFLTGVSKVYSYNRGIFADQQFQFLQLLRQQNTMLMSGYGWSDIPINFQLQNWLARDAANRLILLHQSPEELADGSFELRHIYNKYKQSGQIIPIEKWLSDTELSDIEEYL